MKAITLSVGTDSVTFDAEDGTHVVLKVPVAKSGWYQMCGIDSPGTDVEVMIMARRLDHSATAEPESCVHPAKRNRWWRR